MKPGFYREVSLATRIQGGEKPTSCSVRNKGRKCTTLKQGTAFSVRIILFHAVLTIICMKMNFSVPNGNETQASKGEMKEKSKTVLLLSTLISDVVRISIVNDEKYVSIPLFKYRPMLTTHCTC